MASIFLSYSREDRASAERLARLVEDAGHEVWWDRHLDSGEEFAAEIEAALDKAEVVLVAWSKLSVKSRWVRDEASVGGDTGRLVPVSIDGTLPPMGFRQFHTLDLAGWKGGKRDPRTNELLHSIERKLGSNGGAAAVPKSPQAKRQLTLPANIRIWGLAAALVLVIAAAVAIFINREKATSEAESPSLALLPFTATSSDATLRDLAAQARSSVAHAFSDSGVPIKLIDSVPSTASPPPSDYLLSAEISADADKLVANVRMEDAAQRVTVWSRQIEADRKDAAALPDRIGAHVAGSLTWAGVIRNLYPQDPVLTAKLLQDDIIRDPLQNYQNAQRMALQSPKVGMAQLGLAIYTGFALPELPREQRGQAVAAARQAADRAKSLMPHFGDVFIPSCLLQPTVRMAECEDQLRAGLKADPDAPFVNQFLSYNLKDVGRTQEAFDRASLSYQHDPYMPAKISNMIKMFEIAGQSEDADSLYRLGIRWWPEWGFFRSRVMGIIERGDFESLHQVELEPGAEGYGRGHPNSGALAAAVKARSLPQLKRTCGDSMGSFYAYPCMLAFARLGDLESAYALADDMYPRQLGRTPRESEQIWLDNPGGLLLEIVTSVAAAPMRRDRRFLQLAERTGLLAYWRSGRPPDFCRQNPEPVCLELLNAH